MIDTGLKKSKGYSVSPQWKLALTHAAPVSLFVLGLFHYWFAIADRHTIFLYGHLGATPFDRVTSGRYWMSGLVASGGVMIAHVAANWLLGRVASLRHRVYAPPVLRQTSSPTTSAFNC